MEIGNVAMTPPHRQAQDISDAVFRPRNGSQSATNVLLVVIGIVVIMFAIC